jgi:hypothetical protein
MARWEGVQWDVLRDVHAPLEKLLPGRVLVTPQLGGVQPDEGVEAFLREIGGRVRTCPT